VNPQVSFFRYAVVGILSNSALYIIYLTATGLGAEPKIVMTALYGLGVLQTFPFNKRWSFGDKGPEGAALMRYSFAYASGYALNYAALVAFAGYLHLGHQYVQGITIILIAGYLYILQRVWVFARSRAAVGDKDARKQA